MRKLMLVKREDRIRQASAETLASCGMKPAVVKPGDVVLSFPELRVPTEMYLWLFNETSLEYTFAMSQDIDCGAFLIPKQDVQEIPTDYNDMLSIIMILM